MRPARAPYLALFRELSFLLGASDLSCILCVFSQVNSFYSWLVSAWVCPISLCVATCPFFHARASHSGVSVYPSAQFVFAQAFIEALIQCFLRWLTLFYFLFVYEREENFGSSNKKSFPVGNNWIRQEKFDKWLQRRNTRYPWARSANENGSDSEKEYWGRKKIFSRVQT